MKRMLSIILCIILVLSLAACASNSNPTVPQSGNNNVSSNPPSDGGEEDKPVIVTILQSQQITFWQHIMNTWERLAEENGFEIVFMDANSDVSTFQNCIDDILILQPDGAAICGVDGATMDIQVKQLQDAGIPTVAYNITPDKQCCPIVMADNFQLGYLSGKAGGEWWVANRADDIPVGASLTIIGNTICQDRVDGFVAGFKESCPDFALAADLNGNATRAESLNATLDVLQAHPEVNVFFGINGDSALGALDALKESGLGTCDISLVCGIDATEGECQEMKDATSALRLSAGNSPKLMAEAAYNLLKECMDGTRDAYSYSEYPLDYVLVTEENADTWTQEHFE